MLKEYLEFGGEKFKYLRALAVFYIRLTRPAKDVYTLLEPYLNDRRKLRRRGRAGTSLTFVDQFVDDLLTKERVCATTLWKMPKREILEDLEVLEPRISALGDIEDLLDGTDDDDIEELKGNDRVDIEIGEMSSSDGEIMDDRAAANGD